MQTHNVTPRKSLFTRQTKDKANTRYKQLAIVKAAFKNSPATMLMIAKQTGIERANICRYVARLQKAGVLVLVKKGLCPITGFRAGFYIIHNQGGRMLC